MTHAREVAGKPFHIHSWGATFYTSIPVNPIKKKKKKKININLDFFFFFFWLGGGVGKNATGSNSLILLVKLAL